MCTMTKEQKRMLDRKDFGKLDELLRDREIVLLQNISTGEFAYVPYEEYEKRMKELNQAGILPVGEQFEQTFNPFKDLEKSNNTPPPASNNNINENADKENIFDKIKNQFKDFELPFSKTTALVLFFFCCVIPVLQIHERMMVLTSGVLQSSQLCSRSRANGCCCDTLRLVNAPYPQPSLISALGVRFIYLSTISSGRE